MDSFEPAYVRTIRQGRLKEKIKKAEDALAACVLCPRRCGVNRLSGERGVCKTGRRAHVSSFDAHFGEEAPLVGANGSGTIFFTHCNLMCIFCQNYDISHLGVGNPATDEQLAEIMLALQRRGCHNINFVTPTHVTPAILAAVELAAEGGLRLPLVYNCGGYECVETLKLLDGVVDIYMPDFKFWDPKVAADTCDAPDYPSAARKALKEMHRQVGDLVTDASGVAERGVLLRHLVMPGGLAGTREIMKFIAVEISTNTYVNIMPQYRPCGRAHEVPGLSASPSDEDFEEAFRAAREEGVTRLDERRRVFRFF